ncbi:MAG: hypothetical protein RIR00_1157, partial [Pseudomonadota bacterium]
MTAALSLSFSLPNPGPTLERLCRLLRQTTGMPTPRSPREHWLCHDSPDDRLQRDGIWLARRPAGRRWRQKLVLNQESRHGEGKAWEQTVATAEWNFLGIPDPALRRRLEQLQAEGALEPRYRLTRQLRQWQVGPVSLHLAAWEGEAGSRQGGGAVLQLAAPAGAAAEFATLLASLLDQLPLLPVWQDEAAAVATWALQLPHRPRKAGASPLRAGLTPVAALRTIVSHCLAQIEANRQGALQQDAPEFIHQMRVGLRRLRSALACFAPLLPDGLRQHYAEPLRQLTNRVGALRDWDVQIEDMLLPALAALGESPAQLQLLTRMRTEALRVRQAVRATLA